MRAMITDMMTSIFRKYRIIRAVHRLKPSKYAAEDRDRRVEAPMLIYLLAFVGGVLTILSPCILPVLPFVFARADQPFRRSGLPLLVGMALTFSVVAIAAAFGGHWVVRLNQGGRYVAMLIFLVLGGVRL